MNWPGAATDGQSLGSILYMRSRKWRAFRSWMTNLARP